MDKQSDLSKAKYERSAYEVYAMKNKKSEEVEAQYLRSIAYAQNLIDNKKAPHAGSPKPKARPLETSLSFEQKLSLRYASEDELFKPYLCAIKLQRHQMKASDILFRYQEFANDYARYVDSSIQLPQPDFDLDDKQAFTNIYNVCNEVVCNNSVPKYALHGNADPFPMHVSLRNDTNVKLVRPVFIDAVGVTLSYMNRRMHSITSVADTKLFQPIQKIISEVVLRIVLQYICMGHKVTVVLPRYYEPRQWQYDVDRVDNAIIFEHLLQCDIVKFLDCDTDSEYFHALLNRTKQVEGMLITDHIWYSKQKPKDGSHFERNEKGEIVLRSCDRPVQPLFINNVLCISHTVNVMCSNQNKYETGIISGKELIIKKFNDELDNFWYGDSLQLTYAADTRISIKEQLENQLLFSDQKRILDFLVKLISPLPLIQRYECMIILLLTNKITELLST